MISCCVCLFALLLLFVGVFLSVLFCLPPQTAMRDLKKTTGHGAVAQAMAAPGRVMNVTMSVRFKNMCHDLGSSKRRLDAASLG